MALIVPNDDFDVDLLRDKPTLFYERLGYFLGDDDVDRVLMELNFICQQCWDAERGLCACDD